MKKENKKMKKLLNLSLIIALLIGMLFILTACGGETKVDEPKETTAEIEAMPTYTAKSFKVTATVPAIETVNEEKEKVVTPNYTVSTSNLKYSNADVGIIGENVEFDFDYTSYSYNTYLSYKEKYDSKEPSYENYLEYLNDPDFDSDKGDQKNFEEVTVAGYNAIKYKFNKSMIYVIKCDELDNSIRFELRVTPISDETKIEDLLTNEEVTTIMKSFKINAYSK